MHCVSCRPSETTAVYRWKDSTGTPYALDMEDTTRGGVRRGAPCRLWCVACTNYLCSRVPTTKSIILFACASPDEFYPAGQVADSGSDSDNQVIVAAYELTLPGEVPTGEASLEYLGQWLIHGKLSTVGLRAEHDRTHSALSSYLPV